MNDLTVIGTTPTNPPQNTTALAETRRWSNRCRRSCCWTPYGHAPIIIGCSCHPPTLEMLIAMRASPIHPDVA